MWQKISQADSIREEKAWITYPLHAEKLNPALSQALDPKPRKTISKYPKGCISSFALDGKTLRRLASYGWNRLQGAIS